jgi:hypothetical protein
MTLNTSGNLGLGVTPSAWNANSRALQLSQFVSLSHQNNASLNLMSFALETSANAFTYAETGAFPLRYNQNPNNGVHSWYTAPSGTAGNAISFTQAMTLGSNSGLSIGTLSAAPAQGLLVQGAANFNSSVTAAGYITGQGNNPGGLGGSRYVLDWLSGQMRLFSYGANSSTNGGFLFNSQRSDGTNSINYLNIASTGAATFSSSVTQRDFHSVYAFGGNIVFNTTWSGSDNGNTSWYSGGVIKTQIHSNGVSYFNGGNVLIGTTTSGSSKLRIVGLPTSAAGLSSGDVYNLAGSLMIA